MKKETFEGIFAICWNVLDSLREIPKSASSFLSLAVVSGHNLKGIHNGVLFGYTVRYVVSGHNLKGIHNKSASSFLSLALY